MSEQQDFSNPLYFIIDRLKDLSSRFDTIQRDLTAIQGSLVSRNDIKDLRDYTQRELQAERDRCDNEFEAERAERIKEDKALSDKVGQLQIKAAVAGVISGAVISVVTGWIVHNISK